MKENVKSKRLAKLKALREQLCEKEKKRNTAQKTQAWLIEQVNELKKFAECENCTVDTLKDKIAQIMKELNSERGSK